MPHHSRAADHPRQPVNREEAVRAGLAAFLTGSTSTNRTPLNRQNTISGVSASLSPPRVSLDYFVVSYWARAGFGPWASTWKRLDELKGEVGSGRSAGEIELGGATWQVLPYGADVAGRFCRWVLVWSGVRLYVTGHRFASKDDKDRANLLVHCPSEPLMHWGAGHCRRVIGDTIADLGFGVHSYCISRVDVCADIPGLNMQDLYAADAQGHVVSRCKEWSRYGVGYRATGVNRGNKAVRMRCYDKGEELESKPNIAKEQALRDWFDDELPEELTRIEFQLMRDWLRDHDVDTWEDLYNKLPEILHYLTHDWYRQTNGVVDRRNSQRYGPSKTWRRVVAAFASWQGEPREPLQRSVKASATAPMQARLKSLVGSFISYAIRRGEMVYSPYELATQAFVFFGGLDHDYWREKWDTKAAEYRKLHPAPS